MAKSKVRNLQDLPVCLRIDDVAEVLGVSLTNAWALTKRDDFPVVRISPRRLIVPRDLFLTWLEGQAK